SGTPGFLALSYPDGGQSVRVVLSYDHALWTPVLRNLWGGGAGSVRLSASATFFLPPPTAVPLAVATSTPLPPAPPTPPPPTSTPTLTPTSAATATPTITPTRTATSTETPVPPLHCTITIPALSDNGSYTVLIQTTAPGTIAATWTMRFGERENIELDVYSVVPPAEVASNRVNAASVSVTTPSVGAGSYSVEFLQRA